MQDRVLDVVEWIVFVSGLKIKEEKVLFGAGDAIKAVTWFSFLKSSVIIHGLMLLKQLEESTSQSQRDPL